ncbi:MAG: hypothetical protein AB7H93_20590 [Vicinamibacterales bacterium]
MRSAARGLVVPCLALAVACDREFEGGGDLRAQRVVLAREVEGLRALVERMERGEPMIPADDIGIAIEDTLVRDLIAAQLPFDADVDRFHLRLVGADVQFRGSPVVRLSGELVVRDQPSFAGKVTLIGALEQISVDQRAATLTAKVAADHLSIDEATGLTQWLSGATLDEIARMVRLEIRDQLPTIQIPVKVRQEIAFPAVTDGPVRLAGARMPLEVAVSQVTAARGRLWIAVRVTPGAFVKTADAPAAGDASATDADMSLDDAPAARRATPAPARPRR